MFPLRGLWNHAPDEGDQFVNVEIDWTVSPPGQAVQFSLSGNSPVALSQIVALSVDNGRSGVDVDFIFPDSGFVLTVPAHDQGVYPVFTNALMFYASAPGSAAGDITIVQILNSLPPPVPVQSTQQQNHASIAAVSLVNGSTPLLSLVGVNGTLNTMTAAIDMTGAGSATIQLQDGAGHTLWYSVPYAPAAANPTIYMPLTGLNVRFLNGLVIVVAGSTLTGNATFNFYYSIP
jgi:hypothetical protein